MPASPVRCQVSPSTRNLVSSSPTPRDNRPAHAAPPRRFHPPGRRGASRPPTQPPPAIHAASPNSRAGCATRSQAPALRQEAPSLLLRSQIVRRNLLPSDVRDRLDPRGPPDRSGVDHAFPVGCGTAMVLGRQSPHHLLRRQVTNHAMDVSPDGIMRSGHAEMRVAVCPCARSGCNAEEAIGFSGVRRPRQRTAAHAASAPRRASKVRGRWQHGAAYPQPRVTCW
jgi:hypothetical protein